MTEETKPAAPAEAPVEPAAPAPAPGSEPAPDSQPPSDPVKDLEDRLGRNLTETEKRLAERIASAEQKAVRAQSAADKNYARAKAEFDRELSAIEALLSEGVDESRLRVWKAERENSRLKAERDSVDKETTEEKARSDFRDWSSALLAEEQIDASDPAFKTAWDRHAPKATNPAEWRVALTRAVADFRREEGKKAAETEREKAQKAIEEERKKATNAKRESAGPVDSGPSGGAKRHDPDKPPENEADFAVWWEERKKQRLERQRQTAMAGGRR